MEQHSLEKLEYFNILKKLSTYSCTYIGKELCVNTRPSYSFAQVEIMQAQINEAFSFIIKYGIPPLSDFPDVLDILIKLESSYTLSIKNILEINHILKLSSELQKYFYSSDNINVENFPVLNALFSLLYVNTNLSREIEETFFDVNTVNDKASPVLFDLRKNRRKKEQDIKDRLNSFLHSSTYQKYLQESVITIRNDRYVIPVKNESRSFIKGFIHDISASGSTAFIEPISVFEINNEINNIKIEESIEIERILDNFSNKLSSLTSEINTTIKAIGDIDYLFAKAKYSKNINATSPILNKNKEIYLIDARNPLIDEKKVVPISINLGKDFQTLVITGPNTGGKTVTLKTVGLICLMAYSGLYIPAKENSTIPVFDMISADIGDEQSIQESLSTFSSHIINIINIINAATSDSLILLDELGSGTDPNEGSALAISILEFFHNLNSLTIATTHYSEIKEYALVTEGFENASSDFDIDNLKPTFHLILGVPGKSNAFAISKRLGLPDKIIERGKSLIDSDAVHIEELLKNIYDNKLFIEHEKEEIQKKINQIDLLKHSLEDRLDKVELKKKEIIDKAKVEARDILLYAKKEASNAIKEINKLQNSSLTSDIKDLNKIRNNLNSSIKSTSTYDATISTTSNNSDYTLEPNMEVYISNLNQYGIILSISQKANEAQVQVGNSKLTINKRFLTPIKTENTRPKKVSSVHYTNNVNNKHAATEINLLGMTVEEAIFVIDKFLDDASLQHINSVRIVHGKGTGALKNGIHKFLKTHPHVKSYRLGTFGEGEMGVTIVDIEQ